MNDVISNHLPALESLCAQFGVRRLELFGSGTTERFDPERSDLDFLVDFDRSVTSDVVDQYFGFHESLERLFNRKVDLLEVSQVQNPYLKIRIDRSRRLLYAA